VAGEPKRVTLVADELLGYAGAGGLGTATTFLAVALGRAGHDVDVLYAGDVPTEPLAADWARLYESADVTLRLLARSERRTEPAFFARMLDAENALVADPPDVVITQDLAAPVYTALRRRQLGLGLEDTLFVVYCHGTRQWISDVARKVRVLPGALAISVLEQASIELADVVVSPSMYLLQWMREQGWRLPEQSFAVPYLTRSTATGDAPPVQPPPVMRLQRLVFFGRLEERKGLRPFTAGLNSLDADLLRGVELEFLGRPTPAWPPDHVTALLSDETAAALSDVSFATDLDQAAALEHLSRPGTLAVIPSLEDNSPNAVYECLERGIPFVASRAGGIAELVAEHDRERVLFDPTPNGVAGAVARALEADAFPAASFAFDTKLAVDAWDEVVGFTPPPLPAAELSEEAEWIVRVDRESTPRDGFVARLRHAQAASGADVVTCGLSLDSGAEHYFLGDPGGLGLVSNAYGTAALIRRSLLEDGWDSRGEDDPAWPLLAHLVLSGASLVSLPEALVRARRRPGDVKRDPAGALAVLREFERHLPETTRSLARLAAGLAAHGVDPHGNSRRRLPKLLSRR
jgi:glycosyltransferase involved in cell wall biosynthesis